MKSIINIKKISEKLDDFFNAADPIGRLTKFVQRGSPLSGSVFLKAVVFAFLEKPTASLNNIAQKCLKLGVKISPQGIDERINQYSVAFIKTMFQYAFEGFQNKLKLPMAILRQFTAIYIVDSTFKQLPASMAALYPGSGGKASPASLKVQLVFEFLCGNLTQLVVEAGRAADQGYTKYLEVIQAGALILTDLGYFCLASLRTIADKGAYFISRYHYPTTLSLQTGEKIDLLALLQKQGAQMLDMPILLAAHSKAAIACRLIATVVPLTVAEERRRKARRNAATHGKTLSACYLMLLGWSIFLTNTPESMLSASQVMSFYRIRWQIELIFKFWKSYCGLSEIPAIREERVLTEFYVKLLIAVIVNFLIAPIRVPDDAIPNRELSLFQVRDILSGFAQPIVLALSSAHSLQEILQQFFIQVDCFGYKQIRHKKPNVCAMLNGLIAPSPLA